MVRPGVYELRTKEIKQACMKHIYSITKEDGLYDVKIEKHVDDKSAEQRNFLHLLIGIMAKELGYLPQEMKSVLKREIIGCDEVEYKGKTVEIEPSTEALKKYGYSEFISGVYVIASGLGITLPAVDLRKRG